MVNLLLQFYFTMGLINDHIKIKCQDEMLKASHVSKHICNQLVY